MEEGRLSDGTNSRTDDQSRFSANPFVKLSLSKAPRLGDGFSVRTLAIS